MTPQVQEIMTWLKNHQTSCPERPDRLSLPIYFAMCGAIPSHLFSQSFSAVLTCPDPCTSNTTSTNSFWASIWGTPFSFNIKHCLGAAFTLCVRDQCGTPWNTIKNRQSSRIIITYYQSSTRVARAHRQPFTRNQKRGSTPQKIFWQGVEPPCGEHALQNHANHNISICM